MNLPNVLRLLAGSCATILLAATVPSSSAAVAFPLVWRWSNPTPHGGNITEMAYANGFTIQVAERGQIFTSQDGVSWIPRDSHTTAALRGVTFLGGRILVTGESGTVLFADDPAVFYTANVNTSDWLESVTASASLAVAVGDNAAIYTSTTGVTWQRQLPPFNNWLRSVSYGAGVFVTVGERGLIATSPNGTNWTVRTSGLTTDLNRVSWVGDHFLVTGDGGKSLTSPGGITWTSLATGATNHLYAAAGSTLTQVVAGDSEVRLHEGTTWSNQISASSPQPVPAWTYYAGFWEGTGFALGGRSGMYVTGYRTNTPGPMLWPTQTNPIRSWLWQLIRLPDFYLTVGDHGTILSSINGSDWDLSVVPAGATNIVLLGVGGTTNLLIAAGSGGTLYLSPSLATNVVSTNASGILATNAGNALGIIWHAAPQNLTTNDLQGVAWFGNQYLVSGGNGTILASADGTNWVKRTTPTTKFLSWLEAYPGGLIASGDGGVLLTSANGTNWAAQVSGTTNWLNQVRYLNGRFIAVGENGTLRISANGTNWAAQVSGTTNWLNAVEFVDDNYFVVGNQGTVLVSTDATNWTNVGTSTRKSLYGVARNGGQVVAVGVEGAILRTQAVPLSNPVEIQQFSRTSEALVFLFAGQRDQRFNLERSPALTNWTASLSPLEILDSSGTLLYLEAADTNTPPAQFYRTQLAP